HLRLGVKERVDWRGRVLEPLDEDGARQAISTLKDQGVESYAVSLLFSFLNNSHEERLKELINDIHPQAHVSLSSEVLPEIREYERTSTTTISAMASPVVGEYIARLRRELSGLGVKTPLKIIKSNGGVMTAEAAAGKVVDMFESGPAGGLVAAGHLGRVLGLEDIITLDMGGTTTDVGIISHGSPVYCMEKDIEWNIPIRVPMFDISSIGAGGGSVGWVDKGGALNVGPRSAGADPGPVCYGRGGQEPTVTDANLVLGRLNPDNFLGGQMAVDLDSARQALADRIGRSFGWDAVRAASAVFSIACANMGHLLNERTIMQGLDPRDFTLVVYGGSGGLFAGRLAAEAGLPRVIIPRHPAAFSALGCLLADTKYDYVRSFLEDTRGLDMARLNTLLEGLSAQAAQDLSLEESTVEPDYSRFLDLRYSGEFYEITVPFTFNGQAARADLEAAIDRFHQEHERLYGLKRPHQPVEMVNLRLRATLPADKPDLCQPLSAPAPDQTEPGSRQVFFEEETGFLDTPIHRREALPPGATVQGPAIIEEPTSTTVIFPGQNGSLDQFGNIIITAA
ncbi:MAG: hydantoinase/oxoprolinase family protein, partial [Deltaproteobacteria bacterium]|nr:hydantoinase/oxoprolinase family protein [Deltaproteobacteria bacterium]